MNYDEALRRIRAYLRQRDEVRRKPATIYIPPPGTASAATDFDTGEIRARHIQRKREYHTQLALPGVQQMASQRGLMAQIEGGAIVVYAPVVHVTPEQLDAILHEPTGGPALAALRSNLDAHRKKD